MSLLFKAGNIAFVKAHHAHADTSISAVSAKSLALFDHKNRVFLAGKTNLRHRQESLFLIDNWPMKSRVLISTLVACLLITNNIQAQAHPHETRKRLPDGSPEAMMTEVIVRPLSLAGTVLGGAIHVITWPFAALGGQDTTESRRQLIDKPLEATFKRPLGDFTRLKEINRGKHQPVDRAAKTVPLTVILGQPSATTPETPTHPKVNPGVKEPAQNKTDEGKTPEPRKEEPEETTPLKPTPQKEKPDGEKKPDEIKPSEETTEPKKETPEPVEPKIYQSPSGKVYPAHWGAPPLRQTRDLRPLPGAYGSGSGTLARWIQENLDLDALPKTEDPEKEKKPAENTPNEEEIPEPKKEAPAPVDPPTKPETPEKETKPNQE